MSLKCGLVGLPNVGKSTFFNALAKQVAAKADNYPFCTIEPNFVISVVNDERLNTLAHIANSQKIVPCSLEFVDIAGLVKGAASGEGLGNKFLSHIRETDIIIHIVRCFEDEDITSYEGVKIDPVTNAQTIELELILADLERVTTYKKKNLSAKASLLLVTLTDTFNKGLAARDNPVLLEMLEDEELQIIWNELGILTIKPTMFIANIAEQDLNVEDNKLRLELETYAKTKNTVCIPVSCAFEMALAPLSDEEQLEFLACYDLKQSGLNRVVKGAYDLLQLITFFTVGPKETRAWTIKKGQKAVEAAGKIHSDIARGFICAETIGYDDFIEFRQEAKNMGKIRQEGKQYVVKDADIFDFRFNV